MNQKILLVVNPVAGKAALSGKAPIKDSILDILDLFVKNGYDVTVHTTQRKGDAVEYVKENGSTYDIVVCSGGDGTLNETINGIMQCEKKPTLAYLPGGTMNDFAASHKISSNALSAAKSVVSGKTRPIDLGKLGDRYFSYVAAFGCFTDVSYQTDQQAKNSFGRMAYIFEALKRLPTISAHHVRVASEEMTVEDDFILGMMTNTVSVGGIHLNLGKALKMDDGLAEVILIRHPKTLAEEQALIGAVIVQDWNYNGIVRFQSKSVRFISEEELPFTIDGEYGGAFREALLTCENHAITLCV